MISVFWGVLVIAAVTLTLIKVPTKIETLLETLLGEKIEFEGLLFAIAAFLLRASLKLVLLFAHGLASFFQLSKSVLGLVWENWYKPSRWLAGWQVLFERKYHLVEKAGIYYSIGNLFYICLLLRPDAIAIALWHSLMDLSLDPLINLTSDRLTLPGILSFALGLSGVGLYFYHTCFIDIFYGRFHDPLVKKTSLEAALPNRGYTVFGAAEFHCFEQEVRLARSGHTTFGGPKAAMFSFAMAVLSERLQGKVRSQLLPAAFFEYIANHSPALRDVGYAVRSVLDPVLNPVGFSNLLALTAALLVTGAEGIASLTLSGEVAQIHRVAFAAGFLTAVKKLGWIVATVHGRVDLVFKARAMRSLFVQEPPPPAWKQAATHFARLATQTWPWLGTATQRLGSDLWKSMGNLYALLGWFSLIFIEGEFAVSAWEQIREPLHDRAIASLSGESVAPLVGVVSYTLLRNPEAIYRIGMAAFYLPAFWLYTKLSDGHVTLPSDEVGENALTIANIDWLLHPEWQWFWDELLADSKSNDQKYVRLQAVIANPEWLELTCKHLGIHTSESRSISLMRLAFRPIQPKGWFSFLKSQEERQRTEKAQQVISGYLKQLEEIETNATPEVA